MTKKISLTDEQVERLTKLMLEDSEETCEHYIQRAKILFNATNSNGIYTLEEIATTLCITRERVRQIEETAITKLKHPKISLGLFKYIREDWDI
jgi:DNA-directed RNA polymerase sigma subunit (sigma70/sigma32)